MAARVNQGWFLILSLSHFNEVHFSYATGPWVALPDGSQDASDFTRQTHRCSGIVFRKYSSRQSNSKRAHKRFHKSGLWHRWQAACLRRQRSDGEIRTRFSKEFKQNPSGNPALLFALDCMRGLEATGRVAEVFGFFANFSRRGKVLWRLKFLISLDLRHGGQ
jgi:hypothetical protein